MNDYARAGVNGVSFQASTQPGVTSIIIGANEMSQLEGNLKSAEIELTAEEVARLSVTTEPRTLYPQWLIERQNEGRE